MNPRGASFLPLAVAKLHLPSSVLDTTHAVGAFVAVKAARGFWRLLSNAAGRASRATASSHRGALLKAARRFDAAPVLSFDAVGAARAKGFGTVALLGFGAGRDR